MTEHDRATAYEAIGCALAILERLKYRAVPDEIHHTVTRAKQELAEAQMELHRLTGPLHEGGRVIGG
jgi:hypothetical protein